MRHLCALSGNNHYVAPRRVDSVVSVSASCGRSRVRAPAGSYQRPSASLHDTHLLEYEFDNAARLSKIHMKLPAISFFVCTQKGFCRCEFLADYSAVFLVFGPVKHGVKHDALVLEHMLVNRSIHTERTAF